MIRRTEDIPRAASPPDQTPAPPSADARVQWRAAADVLARLGAPLHARSRHVLDQLFQPSFVDAAVHLLQGWLLLALIATGEFLLLTLLQSTILALLTRTVSDEYAALAMSVLRVGSAAILLVFWVLFAISVALTFARAILEDAPSSPLDGRVPDWAAGGEAPRRAVPTASDRAGQRR